MTLHATHQAKIDPSEPAEALTIDPPAELWGTLIGRKPSQLAIRFREQIGLASTTPIITTGHQPIVFHPGILAKFIAADAAANQLGGSAAWIIADQDTPDVLTLRRPIRSEDGSLGVSRDRLTDQPVFNSVAVASQEPVGPIPLAAPFDRVSEAFAASSGAMNLAHQALDAVAELMRGLVEPADAFFASQLHQTDLFHQLLDVIEGNPEACIRSYNRAVAEFPEARLRAMETGERVPGRVELPLWRLEAKQPRVPVFADQISQIPREQLAPRAVLLDGLVRLGAADLFIHGTGGQTYSQATDRWFAEWMPTQDADSLAPVVTVSATRTIDTGMAMTTPQQADRAVWAAQHARHTPALLGDSASEQRKGELLDQIRSSPRRSDERAELFSQLTALLGEVRSTRVEQLNTLDAEAIEARARAEEHHIASDRTWPFAAYPDQTLHELGESIRAEFA